MALTINPQMITLKKCAPYIATLEGDERNEFISDMLGGASTDLQARCDDADKLYTGIDTVCSNISDNAISLATTALAAMETVATTVTTTVTGTAGPYPVTATGSGAGQGSTTTTLGAKVGVKTGLLAMQGELAMAESDIITLRGIIKSMALETEMTAQMTALEAKITAAKTALQSALGMV